MNASEQVRTFYDLMPYPPPIANLDRQRTLYQNPDHRRAQFHLVWPAEPLRTRQNILIAGCGTSQAARYALREPDARVTAIDVSETSLGHTRDLQRTNRLDNLELHLLPIERVHELGRAFDLVVCTGVLHHLPDPDRGLRALREVLTPQGAMRLMVYAPYGRAGIYMMQDYCKLLGIGSSEPELRELCATLDALPADHPISIVLRRARELRGPAAIADALLHPVDRAFTVAELFAWLERCGMSFGRWVEQAPYLPQCGTVATSPHAARLAALPARQQYAALELFRGTMFSHSVIAYRDDRVDDHEPVTFSDDRWRAYIPLSRPSTVCVRERVPPGCVAVLINRAHSFTDLICTVDAFEARLLGAIDGKRTLGAILQTAGNDADSERRGLRFFERLWQYDHIVLDASLKTHGRP